MDLNQILSLRIPLGYILIGLLLCATTVYAVKKAWALTTGLLNKIPFVALSAAFFATLGLGTGGYSIGDLVARNNLNTETTTFLTNRDLINLATDSRSDEGRVSEVLNYATNRDQEHNYVSLREGKQIEDSEKPLLPLSSAVGLLGLGIACLLIGAACGIRYANMR
jgi:hypothetical protein